MARVTSGLLVAVVTLGWSAAALAQGYSGGPGDPCTPERNIFGGFKAPSAQRQQACTDLRKSQWDDYHARQRAAQDRRDAEASQQQEEQAAARRQQEQALARQQEALAAAQAEQVAAQQRQERIASQQRQAAYFEEASAEKSPDNRCRVPEVARMLMQEWNDFDQFKDLNIRVVDIEHLVTTKFDAERGEMACHGVFVTTKNLDLLGTLSTKKNVAGDPIFSWQRDESQDLSIYTPPAVEEVVASPQTVVVPASEDVSASANPASFAVGLADRKHWESWLAGLSGDQKDGATWWASNRNTPHHVGCDATPEKDNATWEAGCLNAQQMLTPIDLKRRSDQVYKKGWNSF